MKATIISKYIALAAIALAPAIASAATMSVSPASQTVKAGDTFVVSIKLDTQGEPIDGIDIRYLTFNPSVLQVVDGDPKTDGIQINAESLMPTTATNSVNNPQGKILFSQIAKFGSQYKGSGTLATVQFKAISGGNSSLVFSFSPKSTTDTNVAAAKGTDILTAVINGSYTVTGKVTGNTTPAQTVTNPAPADQGTVAGSQTPSTDGTQPGYTSDNLSFWQIIKKMIVDYFTGFYHRLRGDSVSK